MLPDYIVVADVPRSPAGADALWTAMLDPARPCRTPPRSVPVSKHADTMANGANGVSRPRALDWWVLPYSCVILLCTFPFLSRCLANVSTHRCRFA